MLTFLVVMAVAAVLNVWNVRSNPPGFHVDESSVAYNAHLIATTGKDEHGESWPLFFRAFGEYKNPVFIYLLASVFRVTGPSIAVARQATGMLGLIAAAFMGWLALRISRQWIVASFVLATATLTPWLFELSHVVVEVALYPLVIALFLLCVHRSSRKQHWGWVDACLIAISLALLTYTYSIGRVFGPLLALGLALFTTRARLKWLAVTWGLYLLSLAPLVVFSFRHPGALQARFRVLTFITPQTSYLRDAWEFLKHYFGNLNPWWMTVTGDPSKDQIAAISGCPPLLAITLGLAGFGIFLLLRRPKSLERWWWFVVFGCAAAFAPAALTTDYYHTLRLSPAPVFLVVLTIPALMWLREARTRSRSILLAVVLIATLAQGFAFQWQHHRYAHDAQRMKTFDADYPASVLSAAMTASGSAPIYLADAPAVPEYIHAFWYGTIKHISLEKFVVLRPDQSAPTNAVVISSEGFCARCRKLYERNPLLVYVVQESPRSPRRLPDTAMRAEIRPINIPRSLKAGEAATIRVAVRNGGDVTWYAGERPSVPLQVRLGNHWLDQNLNTLVNDDGRSALLRDLAPGQETEIDLTINPPINSGKYILEIDLLQEGVSWFGLRGSKTLQLPITIGAEAVFESTPLPDQSLD
jgi:4-amino-4-deoxy-L-arabinose transferase-like glycosyltransferase